MSSILINLCMTIIIDDVAILRSAIIYHIYSNFFVDRSLSCELQQHTLLIDIATCRKTTPIYSFQLFSLADYIIIANSLV